MRASCYSAALKPSASHALFASHEHPEFAFQKKHILLVEDNPLLQHIHSLWLEQLNYKVTIVDSGEQALAKILSDYDAILMDIDLPGDDGITTTRKLLEKNNIPVIACTSHAESEMKEKCLLAGMIDYLHKPISAQLLKQTLAIHSI